MIGKLVLIIEVFGYQSNMSEAVDGKSALAKEVSNQISQLAAAMFRSSAAEILQLLQREELSMSRALALIFLAHQHCASISDICSYLNLSLGNTSHVIDQLVCAGYVTRTEDANDRRLRQIMLTAKGQAVVHEIKALRVRELTEQLAQLPVPLLQSAAVVCADILGYLAQEEANA